MEPPGPEPFGVAADVHVVLRSRLAMLTWLFDVLQLPFLGMQIAPVDAAFLSDMAKDKQPGKYLMRSPTGIVGVVPSVLLAPAPTPLPSARSSTPPPTPKSMKRSTLPHLARL